MADIILMAETGADIPKEVAEQYGIYIVPMHVQFGEITKDDGAFPQQELLDYYASTKKVPKTAGCNIKDFEKAFDEVHEKYPEKHILYMAYSAVTTCSFASAQIAAEGRDYVSSVDTKQVTIGQCLAVVKTAQAIAEHPEWSVDECVAYATEISARIHTCFIPNNLDFLRAGGRVSNVAALCGNILGLHPLIDIKDGYLLAGKKYRGSLKRVVPQLFTEYIRKYDLDPGEIWAPYTIGFNDDLKELAEESVKPLGVEKITWGYCGGVITSHGGPKAVGVVGISRK